jgi:guanosine-3',5'-bis(diphosphate) 3'-pyrophosphohydrolase
MSTLADALGEGLPGLPPEYYSQAQKAFESAQRVLETNGGDVQLREHCRATASMLAKLGLGYEFAALGLLHHVVVDHPTAIPDELLAVFRGSSRDWVDGLRVCRTAHLREIPSPIYQYTLVDVARALQLNMELVPVLLCGAIDSLERSRVQGRVIGRDLALGSHGSTGDSLRSYAEDALDYLAPFAHYFHLDNLVWRLEDNCFAIQDPERHKAIAGELGRHAEERAAILAELMAYLQGCMEDAGIEVSIQGRPKSIFSIAQKLSYDPRPIDLWEIGDLIALRVVIQNYERLPGRLALTLAEDDISETEKVSAACHRLMEAASSKFALAPGTYRDYIHHPKPTGYQAIHFGIVIPEDIRNKYSLSPRLRSVEVQVRTEELHRKAEYGEWAHFRYKMDPPRRGSREADLDPTVRAKQEWSHNWLEFFTGRIAFRDHAGSMRLIERQATLCDAAYLIADSSHPLRIDLDKPQEERETCEFDDECFYQQLVPWSRVCCLETGRAPDVTPAPARLGAVRTAKARRALAHLIERDNRDRKVLIDQGKRMLSEAQDLTRSWSFSLRPLSHATVFALDMLAKCVGRRAFADIDEFYLGLARGEFDRSETEIAIHLRTAFNDEVDRTYKALLRGREQPWARRRNKLPEWRKRGRRDLVEVSDVGMDDAPLRKCVWLAPCCGPLPGDQIVAIDRRVPPAHRSRLACSDLSVVHRMGCVAAPEPSEARIWGRTWTPRRPPNRLFFGQFELLVIDVPGLLNRITAALAREGGVNIRQVRAFPVYDAASLIWLQVEVRDATHLRDIIDRIWHDLRETYVLEADRRSLRPLD